MIDCGGRVFYRSTNYLNSRMHDKAATIEALHERIKTLKRTLMDTHDWIQAHCDDQRKTIFDWEQLRARILHVVTRTPTEDNS